MLISQPSSEDYTCRRDSRRRRYDGSWPIPPEFWLLDLYTAQYTTETDLTFKIRIVHLTCFACLPV